MSIPSPKSGDQLLDLYCQDLRCHLLEIAAAVDRIERAGGTTGARLDRYRDAARIALDSTDDRARRLLEFLSVP
jgi:hypothetical protein